jgi:hypothetical protein
MEKYKFEQFEIKVLRKIYKHKNNAVSEQSVFFIKSNVLIYTGTAVRIVKSRRLRWTEYAGRVLIQEMVENC